MQYLLKKTDASKLNSRYGLISISCVKHSNFLFFLNSSNLIVHFSQKTKIHNQTCSKCKLQIEKVSHFRKTNYLFSKLDILCSNPILNFVPASFGKKNVAKLTVSEIWLPLIKLNILTFNEYKSVTSVTIEIN